MSTKIYYAHRVSICKLNDYIDFLRPRMIGRAAKIIKRLMSSVKITDDPPKWVQSKKSWEQTKKFEAVLKICEAATKSSYKSITDIECGTNIWLRGKYAYIIPINCIEWPYGDNKIKFPKWVEDYSYWNNTDPPKNISKRKWNSRGNMWGKINCGTGTADHNARRLYHAFVDIKNGLYIGTWEIREKILGKWGAQLND